VPLGPEVELVTRTERRSIVLTFTAATVTVVTVVAVLAGPAMLACAESPDGFAACLRDRIAEYGLLPVREPSASADAPAPEADAPPADMAVALPGAPQLTFLRAQPDGAAVIGGTAGAGARVAVYANGELLGVTTAERSGDWALIPDAPLPVGGAEIVVRGVEDGATGAVSFVVVVDPQGIAQPTVVATTPEQASQVLRDLVTVSPEVATPTAPPTADPEPQPAPAAEPGPEPAAEGTATPALRPAETFTVRAEVPRSLHIGTWLVAQAGIGEWVSGTLDLPAPNLEVVAPDPFTIVAAVPLQLRLGVDLVAAVGARATGSTTLEVPAPKSIVAQADPFTILPETPLVLRAGGGVGAVAGVGATAAALLKLLPEPAVKVVAVDRFTVVPEVPRPLRVAIGVVGVFGVGDTMVAALDLPLPIVPVPDPFTIVPEIVRPQLPEVLIASTKPEAATATPPTIEAIEIDGRLTYFAGAGEEGSTVRLFVEDRLVGESAVEGGRWLVEAADALTATSQRIRAEVALSDRQAVVAAVEADVMLDLPEVPAGPGNDVRGRARDREAPERRRMRGLPRPGGRFRLRSPWHPSAGSPESWRSDLVSRRPARRRKRCTTGGPEASFEPTPSIEIGSGSVAAIAGIARNLAEVEIPAFHHAVQPEFKPMPVPSPSVEVLALPEATPSVVELASTDAGAVGLTHARDNEVPTIRTLQAHDLGAARFSSGKAIIRRGDTLWDIADRVYGDGYKYRTIYRANRDKIRRPGRIYPGQVLDIPLVFDDR
jgi:nucleoid-associated protein YgaU